VASFGPSDATYSTWKQQNDLVMGGASTGEWSQSADYGIVEGTCAVIPKLKVPGFIKATTSGTYADISSCTGIELEVRSDVDYASYRFNFGSDKSSCGKFFAHGLQGRFHSTCWILWQSADSFQQIHQLLGWSRCFNCDMCR